MSSCYCKVSGYSPITRRKFSLLDQNRFDIENMFCTSLAMRCNLIAALIWVARLCFIFAWSAIALSATDILILQSHNSTPYQLTLAGFQSSMASSSLEVAYQRLDIPSSSDTNALIQFLQNYKPKLILTLGTPATRASLSQVKQIPMVAGLVLDIEELGQNVNATGVGLNFPASVQWLWLHRILPEARQIAVLYDPRQGSALFQTLQKQALADGINLIPAPAASAVDLPALIKNLPTQLDALWAVDGAAAYNPAAVRELLLYSFRNRVPLIGLSAQWVKAGALYALDWDYSDLGAQSADLAKDILLKGISPASLTPLTPRKVRPVFNTKTAEHMKLYISDRLLSEMSEVIQ